MKIAIITVRMSAPLHAALRKLSYQRETTMNKLCLELIEKAVEKNEAAALTLKIERACQRKESA